MIAACDSQAPSGAVSVEVVPGTKRVANRLSAVRR